MTTSASKVAKWVTTSTEVKLEMGATASTTTASMEEIAKEVIEVASAHEGIPSCTLILLGLMLTDSFCAMLVVNLPFLFI